MGELTVLVVDDEEILRKTLGNYLEDEGYTVQSASGGAGALHLLKSGHADVMIIDMHLPDMNGESVIRHAVEIDPGLTFIVHTGDTGYQLSDALKKAGLSERNILFKPILDLASISRLIREITGS